MGAVRTLDLVVANQFRDDPVTLAVWDGDRRLNVGRRAKSVAVVAATTPAAAPRPVVATRDADRVASSGGPSPPTAPFRWRAYLSMPAFAQSAFSVCFHRW
jgi:hypothetical protein